jgi:predicted ester cyclase
MKAAEMRDLFAYHVQTEMERDFAATMETFVDDCFIHHTPLGLWPQGKTAVRRHYEHNFSAFPDIHSIRSGMAFDEDTNCLVHWGKLHATMRGPWFGIEPTNKTVEGLYIATVISFRDGKLTGERAHYDADLFCAGLGLDLTDVRRAAAQFTEQVNAR